MSAFNSLPPVILSSCPTPATVSTTMPFIGIDGIKQVPIFAVRSFTSLYIRLMSYSLKVVGIYTKMLSAQMVKFKTIKDSPNVHQICKFMSHNISSLAIYSTNVKQAVTMTILPSVPKPTFILGLLVHLNPKSFLNTIIFFHILIKPRKKELCQWV